jgi:phosphoenolpyruvate carboxykinase (ATP)
LATQVSTRSLGRHGLDAKGPVHWNPAPAALIEAAVRRGEGSLSSDGSFVANTTPHTGRSPNDKFVVREPASESHIWWGNVNVALDVANYEILRKDVLEHLAEQELFVRDVWAGADSSYRVGVRAISPNAWHSLFVHNMFIEAAAAERNAFEPDWVILHAPEFQADPGRHGTRSSTAIVLNIAQKTVLIAGTRYAGEMKKSIFTVMNYVLPRRGVLSMHCSANVGKGGDVALFFGLSGTGKTTLSADPNRYLIGDDEHGWSDAGVFNFEGGNYAKVIRLSAEGEPLIWGASRRFGAILENVVMKEDSRQVDFDDESITENTRSSYPIGFIDGAVPGGSAGHPRHVVFLTADAFGVMPPIARLSLDQAMYHFLSGYTAKVAGTERGVTEPKAAFSACFGAPFLPLPPSVYATMLGDKLRQHGAQCWLVNTGWTGGPYGVGKRMRLAYTRAMIDAMLGGALDSVETRADPAFGLDIPLRIPGVPDDVLDPRTTWADGSAYDAQAARLAGMFRENFSKFEAGVDAGVRQAGPK